ncbi:hypothetical protein [Endozoicomonas sp. GU-1]|uniref:hypothetical protein n=1 Tax=Endozoicomonas sp. GU-1 TaxID=3009078 RepID=UPI0022B533BE|nr:hypothetical protein [Endozoicomonas sp. GU-1]WBA79510.1 hypothetical protein O2T12_14085 [Endozoicomonas sp. GU-1]
MEFTLKQSGDYEKDDVMLIQVNMSEKNNTYYGLRLKGKEMGGFLQKRPLRRGGGDTKATKMRQATTIKF